VLSRLADTHSVPHFQGSESRGHRDVPVWRLAVRGAAEAVRQRSALAGVDPFVQFVGFPRSGHSLIGSVLDAHPRAVVAHELDAMGLFRAGLPRRVVYGLVLENSAAFSAHGRWWNGYRYEVPGYGGGAGAPAVLGDKKGDWAVRWTQREPGLLDRVRGRLRGRDRWVLVTRHPLDNVATLSLRKGRAYDRLRIEAETRVAFRERLAEAQERGDVAAAVRGDMLDDYAGLCEGIEAMRRAVPAERWHHVVYERFTAAPEAEIERLCQFLGLDAAPDYVAAAASIVHDSPNRSRDRLAWTDGQRARVDALVERFPFLHPYADVE
jgi:hypothetical protein